MEDKAATHRNSPTQAEIKLRNIVSEKLLRIYPILKSNKPLKIGIDQDIIELHPEILAPIIRQVIRIVTIKHDYLKNLVVGAERYDLNGRPSGSYVEERKVDISKKPKTTKSPAGNLMIKKKLALASNEVYGEVSARTLKVTVPIDLSSVLNLDTIGKSAARLNLTLPCGTEVTARINAKSFRKAIEVYKSCDGNASVLITGELHPTEAEIKSSGIIINVKQPKVDVPSTDG